MKRILSHIFLVSVAVLCLSLPAFAQYTTFVVDAHGGPTVYPTLAQAIATAQTFAGGPHKIKIMAGNYTDADLTVADPTKIGEIYGDPDAAAGDIVFTSPTGSHNFLLAWNNLKIHHLKLVGYSGYALYGNSASGLEFTDMIIRGASGYGIDLSNTTNALVDGMAFSKLAYGILGNPVVGASIKNSTFDSCGYAVNLSNLTLSPGIDNLTITHGTVGIYLDGGTLDTYVKNCNISLTAQQGIYLNTVSGSQVINNLLYKCGNYGVLVLSSSPNWNLIQNNCFIGNLGGTSQGYDNSAVADQWNMNFYSDHVYTMDGGTFVDANPKQYTLSAVTPASSYNIGDTVLVNYDWTMPACAALDSAKMAAYGFTAWFDPTMLKYVPGSGKYDETYLGPAPPALYTAVDASTPGQITFGAANFTTPGTNGGRIAYATFVVIGANVTSTLGFSGVDFRGPGNVALPFSTAADYLVLNDNVKPVVTSLTANNPAGDNTYSDGSVAGPGPFTKLYLTMTATDNYDLNLFQWNSDGGAWTDWIPVPGAHPLAAGTGGPQQFNFVSLGLPEGTHIAGVRVKDVGGNISDPKYYTYKIDRTAPVVTSVAITDKDGCALDNTRWTNDSVVTLAITSDGTATQMMVSESGDKPIVAFAASSSFTMTGAAGPHTVWVRLYDKYNNRIDWTASNAINLDMVAPVMVGPLTIPAAPKTATKNLTGITPSDYGTGGFVGQFDISENAADLVCGNAGWKGITPANHPIAFTLSNGDGLKHLYLASRDSAGNISNVITNTITLDQTAPVLTAYTLTSLTGLSCTPDGSVKAVYSWTGSDAAKLQYSYNDTLWGDWKTITGLPSPDSTTGSVPGTGVQKLYIRLVDDVGNISNEKVASITVDNAPVTVVAAACVDTGATATPDPIFPGGVTNSKTFNVKLTGVSSNVVGVSVSQDGGTTWTNFAATPTAGAITVLYSWTGTPTPCAWQTLQVKAKNCAGVYCTVLTPQVYFDLVGPSVTAFTGPALTNVAGISLNITAADACGLYQMRLAEGSTAGKPWVAYSPTPSFTLSSGDGNKTINLDVADYGGNIASKSVVVKLDMTPPAGTMVIKSANAAAAAGWTDSQTGNTATLTWSADTKLMAVAAVDFSWNTGWIALSPNVSLSPIVGLVGLDTVKYIFQDSAGNTSGWLNATVNYDPNNPPAPVSAIGMPHGSTILTWKKVPVGQKYYIKYNFQNQYPLYPDPIPPHPLNRLTEGIYATEVSDTTFTFAGPHPDIYSFSIWTLGKNGHYSSSPNVDVTATNYILGDFSPAPDGCLKFGAEFGAMAIAYNSSIGDPNFNDSLDIAPTSNTKAYGYPVPDAKVDFEDLVIFALNYDAFHCASLVNENRPIENPHAASTLPIAVQVTVPSTVARDEEIVVPVKLDNYAEVKGYHVVLDYNTNDFELVRVEPGDAYTSVSQSFFYYDQKSTRIDVSGVVMGEGVTFKNGDFFRAVLRAKNAGDVNVKSNQLTFRDRDNNNISASLGVTKLVALPTAFAVSQNYPNPFNPTTTIQLSLPVASDYKLTIFNVLGQVVKTFAGHSDAGYLTVNWDASGNSSGIYLYRLEAGTYSATKKMVLLK